MVNPCMITNNLTLIIAVRKGGNYFLLISKFLLILGLTKGLLFDNIRQAQPVGGAEKLH